MVYGIACFEGSQPLCCDDAQARLWRDPHKEELRPPASSQHQFASHMDEQPWEQILQFSSSFRWLQPWLTSTTLEIPKQNQVFDPQEEWEVIDDYHSFKPPSLGWCNRSLIQVVIIFMKIYASTVYNFFPIHLLTYSTLNHLINVCWTPAMCPGKEI